MTLLAILHDVHDVEYILRFPEIYDNALLVSTHEAVNDYLLSHRRECISLSSFISIDELINIYQSSKCVYSLLDEMDTEFSSIVNKLIDNPHELPYFYTLYRYLGRYEYTNIRKIQTTIEKISKEYKVTNVHLFSSHFIESKTSFFSTQLNVYKYIFEARGISVTEVFSPLSKKIIQEGKLSKLKRNFRRTHWVLLNKLNDTLYRKITKKLLTNKSKHPIFVNITPKKSLPFSHKGALLLDGIFTKIIYSDLQEHISETINLVEESNNDHQIKIPDTFHEEYNKLSNLILERSFDPLLFLKTILLNDFINQYNQYILPLIKVIGISEKFDILAGIWSSPPTTPSPKTLLTAYLLKNETPVFGYQHGGNYGIQRIFPRHFDSDFWWCTHYFSWGFTQEDLKETYPDAEINCEILPLGKSFTKRASDANHSVGLNIKKQIDILFPISNASYFHRDTLRIPQHLLALYQRDLLKYLDGLGNFSIVIKPFSSFNYKNSAFIELLKDLKHVKVESHLTFTECFSTYKVQAVVTEYPSSPLFEAIHEDVDVFALMNPIIKYNFTAETLLKKRIYLYNTLPEIQRGILDFLDGTLPSRRDTSFAEKYLLSTKPEVIKKRTTEVFGIA